MLETILTVYLVVVALILLAAIEPKVIAIALAWPLVGVWLVYALIKEWNYNRKHRLHMEDG